MGKKYIIELEEEVKGLFKAKGFNTLVFDKDGISKLTPYEEKKEESKGRWKPKHYEPYWHINSLGKICVMPWSGEYSDNRFFAIGNCFRTKEDAEFAVERLKVIAELKEYAETKERSNTAGVQHWHLAYDLSTREVVGTFSFSMHTGEISFENEKTLQKAIDAVGKERIKKYYLEVV